MTRSSEPTGGDAAADLAALRQDVARLVESMGTLAQRETKGAAQRISDLGDDAKAGISTTAAQLSSRAHAAGDAIEARIERNPLTAMLISFGVGMALGVMSRPKR